jgi:hypothetical protein
VRLAKVICHRIDDELARRDLTYFVARIWPWFIFAPHHHLLLDYANQFVHKPNQRLLISLPPRHGKSQIFSTAVPAFAMGCYPDRHMIHISHSAELSNKFSFDVRALARDDMLYRRLFPGMRLHPERRRLDNWLTTLGGGFRSLGVGGGVTGFGANWILLDDPHKEGDERSPRTLREIRDWFASAVRTRLLPGGSICVVHTRWSEDDLIGWLLRQTTGDKWQSIVLPAIATDDDVLGRVPGEALWPELYGLEYLQSIQALNPVYFDALYQQNPRAAVAHPFQREYFKCVDYTNRLDNQPAFWAIDLAITEKDTADFTAMARFQRRGDDLFVSRPYRMQKEWPDVRQYLIGLMSRFPKDRFIFEERLLELLAVQSLRHESGRVFTCRVKGDKFARASEAAHVAESGRILMVRHEVDGVDFREVMIDECVRFPAEHDDLVDVLSLGVHYAGVGGLDFLLARRPDTIERDRLKSRERAMIGRVTT